MRVFVTGATGFIGSLVVQDLIKAGHQVLGLARSEAGAQFLRDAGAEVHRGDLEDLESLRSGAALADGVIHTAFNHDFSKYAANCEADRHAIQALGSPLVGSDRPFIVTSGTLVAAVPPGRPATEDDAPVASSAIPRSASEEAAVLLESKGVRALVVRLPQVHDRLKHGLVSYLIAIARQKRISAFVGDGLNRWPAVHRIDAARLYVLALEKGSAGARYHAVAEEGVPLRDIAAAIGRGLKVPVVALSPEQATSHFGWLAVFVGRDAPAASALTQERLGWHPTAQPGMIDDLDHARDFEGCVPGPCLGGAGLQPISANLLKGNQLPCCRPATRNIVAPAVDYPREAANISNARSTDKRRTKNRRTLADFSLLICLTPASANHLNESVPFVM